MVLEVLLSDQFQSVLSWLRTGELRDRLESLELQANRPKESPVPTPLADLADHAPDVAAETVLGAVEAEPAGTSEGEEEPTQAVSTTAVSPHFADNMIRWAKLPPDLHESRSEPLSTSGRIVPR